MHKDAYSARHIRSGLKTYALGKAITLPGSLALVFVLAAFMPRQEYAAYIAATALLEILIVVGTLGTDWLAQTVIPAVRIHGNGRQTRKAVRRLTLIGAVPYLLLGPALYALSSSASAAVGGVASASLLETYGILLMIEGAGRSQRDQILGALLKQGAVQGVVVFRLFALLSVVLGLHIADIEVTAAAVAYAELAVSTVGLLVGLFVMHRYNASLSITPNDDESVGRWLNLSSLRLAGSAYGSVLLSICLGGDLAITLIARTLGEEATAAVGFALRLIGQIRRLLPIDLLWSVIRPAVIGRFQLSKGSRDALSADISTVSKLNLAALGAAMVVLLSVADPLMHVFARLNVELPPLLLAALMVQVVGHGLRRAYELACFALDQAWLFLKASLASVIVPILLLVLIEITDSLYSLPIAFVVGETVFLAALHVGLVNRGYRFGARRRTAFIWLLSILAGAATATIAAAYMTTPLGLCLSAGIGVSVYIALLPLSRYLTYQDARALIQQFRGG